MSVDVIRLVHPIDGGGRVLSRGSWPHRWMWLLRARLDLQRAQLHLRFHCIVLLAWLTPICFIRVVIAQVLQMIGMLMEPLFLRFHVISVSIVVLVVAHSGCKRALDLHQIGKCGLPSDCLVAVRDLVDYLLRERIILLGLQNQGVKISRLVHIYGLFLYICRLSTPLEARDRRSADRRAVMREQIGMSAANKRA